MRAIVSIALVYAVALVPLLLDAQAPPAAAPPPTAAAKPPISVPASLNLTNASLTEVIDILARDLKINYILDPKIQGKVTINTYGEIRAVDVRNLLETILRMNGFAMVQVGNVFRIVLSADAARLPISPQTEFKDQGDSEQMVLDLVFLKFVTSSEMFKVLEPFVGEGAKMLAYEIAEQMDWAVPDWCVLPVCYGDALLGMWRGFEDMMTFGWTDRMPRMVAAEVSGSLGAALADGSDAPPDMRINEPTVAVSIGASRGTYQALDIIRRSGGAALTIGNEEMMHWQQTLAGGEGIYVELSSAAGPAAIAQLEQTGRIGKHDSVVTLLTASGLKDSAAPTSLQNGLVTVPGDITKAVAALKAAAIFPQ